MGIIGSFIDPFNVVNGTDTAQQSAAKVNAFGLLNNPVAQRQQFLRDAGYNVDVDGVWGNQSQAAQDMYDATQAAEKNRFNQFGPTAQQQQQFKAAEQKRINEEAAMIAPYVPIDHDVAPFLQNNEREYQMEVAREMASGVKAPDMGPFNFMLGAAAGVRNFVPTAIHGAATIGNDVGNALGFSGLQESTKELAKHASKAVDVSNMMQPEGTAATLGNIAGQIAPTLLLGGGIGSVTKVVGNVGKIGKAVGATAKLFDAVASKGKGAKFVVNRLKDIVSGLPIEAAAQITDAFAEGQQVYSQAINEGASEEAALEMARDAYARNAKLSAVLAPVQAGFLGAAGRLINKGGKKGLIGAALNLAGQSGTEGFQEGMQSEYVEKGAQGKPYELNPLKWDKETLEAAKMGALGGLMFGAPAAAIAGANVRSNTRAAQAANNNAAAGNLINTLQQSGAGGFENYGVADAATLVETANMLAQSGMDNGAAKDIHVAIQNNDIGKLADIMRNSVLGERLAAEGVLTDVQANAQQPVNNQQAMFERAMRQAADNEALARQLANIPQQQPNAQQPALTPDELYQQNMAEAQRLAGEVTGKNNLDMMRQALENQEAQRQADAIAEQRASEATARQAAREEQQTKQQLAQGLMNIAAMREQQNAANSPLATAPMTHEGFVDSYTEKLSPEGRLVVNELNANGMSLPQLKKALELEREELVQSSLSDVQASMERGGARHYKANFSMNDLHANTPAYAQREIAERDLKENNATNSELRGIPAYQKQRDAQSERFNQINAALEYIGKNEDVLQRLVKQNDEKGNYRKTPGTNYVWDAEKLKHVSAPKEMKGEKQRRVVSEEAAVMLSLAQKHGIELKPETVRRVAAGKPNATANMKARLAKIGITEATINNLADTARQIGAQQSQTAKPDTSIAQEQKQAKKRNIGVAQGKGKRQSDLVANMREQASQERQRNFHAPRLQEELQQLAKTERVSGLANVLKAVAENKKDFTKAKNPSTNAAVNSQSAPTHQGTSRNSPKMGTKDLSKQTVHPETKSVKAEKIDDFGEKIGGARKDAYAILELSKSVDAAAEPFSKSWPEPNYAKMEKDGYTKEQILLVRALRDEVPDKPIGRKAIYSLNKWVKDMHEMRDFAEQVLLGKKTRDDLEGYNFGSAVDDKIKLYKLVGDDISLRGVKLSRNFYNEIYNDFGDVKENNVYKWSIEGNGKLFSIGDTKEEVVDKFLQHARALKTSKKTVKQTEFSVYQNRDGKEFYIGKKLGRNFIKLKSFDNVKEAREYLKNNQAELESKFAKLKEVPNERNAENRPRVGQDVRNGENATPEMFDKAFGFRGVEFGNWVAGAERQDNLNRAFDALIDLAALLNIPTKAISLNGELGLAFGARGKGGRLSGGGSVSAHYEPGFVAINLTKKSGAGSLAHEWFHAFDNHLSKRIEKPNGFYTFNPYGVSSGNIREEVFEAFNKLRNTLKNETKLIERSTELDSTRNGKYFSNPEEFAARAFESYIVHKLEQKGFSNDYLANFKNMEAWKNETPKGYPYLTDSELKIITPAFDNLFKTLKTEQTDKGVKLYSRTGIITLGGAKMNTTTEPAGLNVSAGKFLKSLGVPVVWVDGGSGFNGFFADGKVYLNSNKPQQSFSWTAGHEWGHWLQESNPGVFSYLGRTLKVTDADVQSVIDKYAKHGDKLTRKQAIQEIVCDKIGNQWDKQSFWNNLEKQPNTFKRVVAALKDYVAKLAAKVGIKLNNELSPTELVKAMTFAFKAGETTNASKLSRTDSEAEINEVRAKYKGTAQWLKAPNGKPSMLNEQQWLQVRTPSFKRWFGDWENDAANASKVVDANGEPLVVYHGTDAKFNEFEKSFQKNGWVGKGFYFTPKKGYAQKNGKQVVACYLNIKTPFRFKGESPDEAYSEIKTKYGVVINDELGASLQKRGYDGAFYRHWDNNVGEMYIAFNPNQIKSATGNIGTFDGNNPDIRYSRDKLTNKITELANNNAKPEEIQPHVDALGVDVIQSLGINKPNQWRLFVGEMRRLLGKAWANVKPLVLKSWRGFEALMKDNSGLIRFDKFGLYDVAVDAKITLDLFTDKMDEKAELLKSLVYPKSLADKAAGVMMAILRQNLARMTRNNDSLLKLFKPLREQMNGMTKQEQLDWIDKVETGDIASIADRKMKMLATLARMKLDEYAKQLQESGKLENPIENYFPHIWKDEGAAAEFSKEYFRSLEGGKSFLKKRTIPTVKEGIEAGLTPAYDNPADMMLMKMYEIEKYLMGRKIREQMFGSGMLKFVAIDKKAPADWELVDDKAFKVFGISEVRVKELKTLLDDAVYKEVIARMKQFDSEINSNTVVGETFLRNSGNLYMPKHAATILKHYLGRGLRNDKTIIGDAFRAMQRVNNTLNGIQLGLSLFHPAFVAWDTAISHLGMGARQVRNGVSSRDARMVQSGTVNVLKGVSPAMLTLGVGALTPVNPFVILPFVAYAQAAFTVRKGGKFAKVYFKQVGATEQDMKILDAFERAGGRMTSNKEYVMAIGDNALSAWQQAWNELQRGNKFTGLLKVGGAALKLPLNLAEKPMKVFFHTLIPNAKAGLFYEMMQHELKFRPDMTEKELTDRAVAIWDSIENRLGMLTYDNLFWNNKLKDALMLSTRSVGWNLGTIRELGGAAADIAQGKQSYKTDYLFSLVAMQTVMAAVMAYLLDDKDDNPIYNLWNNEYRKFFKNITGIKTGYKTPTGEDERVNLPTYWKDVYHYSTDFWHTLGNKTSPLIKAGSEILANKEFYGYKLTDAKPGTSQWFYDMAAYAIQQMQPFGVRGAARLFNDADKSLAEFTGQDWAKLVLPFFGITPAPGNLNKSEAQMMMNEMLAAKDTVEGREKSNKETDELKRNLKRSVRKGDEKDVSEAVAAGKIDRETAKTILRGGHLTPLQAQFKSLTKANREKVWEAANDDEKKELRSIYEKHEQEEAEKDAKHAAIRSIGNVDKYLDDYDKNIHAKKSGMSAAEYAVYRAVKAGAVPSSIAHIEKNKLVYSEDYKAADVIKLMRESKMTDAQLEVEHSKPEKTMEYLASYTPAEQSEVKEVVKNKVRKALDNAASEYVSKLHKGKNISAYFRKQQEKQYYDAAAAEWWEKEGKDLQRYRQELGF